MSYGWARTEILGAMVNSIFLLSLCLYVLLEAIPKLIWPEPMEGGIYFIAVAAAGLVINTLGTIIFACTLPTRDSPSSFATHTYSLSLQLLATPTHILMLAEEVTLMEEVTPMEKRLAHTLATMRTITASTKATRTAATRRRRRRRSSMAMAIHTVANLRALSITMTTTITRQKRKAIVTSTRTRARRRRTRATITITGTSTSTRPTRTRRRRRRPWI